MKIANSLGSRLVGIAMPIVTAIGVALVVGCGNSASPNATPASAAPLSVSPTAEVSKSALPPAVEGDSVMLQAMVWADNWFALYVNGELVGEDSVPLTTERSFNAETYSFEASYPLTIAIEAKDFKETDSGIEYIGQNNQQMGDGGIIAQFREVDTGAIVAATSGEWRTLVVHRAPLNKECEKAANPDDACDFEIIDTPTDWTSPSFDDSGWANASVWSEADVRPKDGYDQITWDSSAQLVWGSDLETDNTVLLRLAMSN